MCQSGPTVSTSPKSLQPLRMISFAVTIPKEKDGKPAAERAFVTITSLLCSKCLRDAHNLQRTPMVWAWNNFCPRKGELADEVYYPLSQHCYIQMLNSNKCVFNVSSMGILQCQVRWKLSCHMANHPSLVDLCLHIKSILSYY